MENQMNRNALLNVLDAAEIAVDGRWNVARLRTVFAENRAVCEALLQDADDNEDEENRGQNENLENAAENVNEPPQQQQPQQQPMQNAQPPQQNTDDLDQQLADLRRRHEILRLRREIEAMERGENPSAQPIAVATVSTPATAARKVNFHDIEHAIVKFSGENRTYHVADFFEHLEQIFVQVKADDLLKALTLRDSLEGTARLLLTRGTLTYDELKKKLMDEFGRTITRQEVYQALQRRNRGPNETIRRYIIEMESIDITQMELVAFIVEGLNGRGNEYAMFSSCRTMEELKRAADMFEQRQAMRAPEKKIETKTDVNKPKPYASNLKTADPAAATTERCYNCSRLGHRQPQCPYENRPEDVCYNCWQAGHDRRQCTNTKYVQKLKEPADRVVAARTAVLRAATAVAAVNTEANTPLNVNWNDEAAVQQTIKELSALQMVSVAFMDENKSRCSENMIRLSLLDTGSVINLIQRTAIPFEVRKELIETKFCGLGRIPIQTHGVIKINAIIQNRCETISLLVVPDHVSPTPILFGRLALKKFEIKMFMIDKKTLNIVRSIQKQSNGINKIKAEIKITSHVFVRLLLVFQKK